MGWVGAIAVSAADDAGGDCISCSIEVSGCTDDSRLTGTVVLFVLGCSPARVSWGVGVVCVTEGVGEEVSGRNCAMSVGDGVANSGLAWLDVSAI